MTTTSRSATIFGLRQFTNYSVQVLALTRVGQGVACRPLYVRTLSDCEYPFVNYIDVYWLGDQIAYAVCLVGLDYSCWDIISKSINK